MQTNDLLDYCIYLRRNEGKFVESRDEQKKFLLGALSENRDVTNATTEATL